MHLPFKHIKIPVSDFFVKFDQRSLLFTNIFLYINLLITTILLVCRSVLFQLSYEDRIWVLPQSFHWVNFLCLYFLVEYKNWHKEGLGLLCIFKQIKIPVSGSCHMNKARQILLPLCSRYLCQLIIYRENWIWRRTFQYFCIDLMNNFICWEFPLNSGECGLMFEDVVPWEVNLEHGDLNSTYPFIILFIFEQSGSCHNPSIFDFHQILWCFYLFHKTSANLFSVWITCFIPKTNMKN